MRWNARAPEIAGDVERLVVAVDHPHGAALRTSLLVQVSEQLQRRCNMWTQDRQDQM